MSMHRSDYIDKAQAAKDWLTAHPGISGFLAGLLIGIIIGVVVF